MLTELQTFIDTGVFIIEASNYGEWYFDRVKRRIYFLAPHHFTSSLAKASELGFGKFRGQDCRDPVRLRGRSGMLAQASICCLKVIVSLEKPGLQIKGLAPADEGRSSTFSVEMFKKELTQALGKSQRKKDLRRVNELIRV